MEFHFLCPFCGQKLKADEDVAGKAVDCPHCGGEFLVPAIDPQPEALPEVPLPGLGSEPQPQTLPPPPSPDGEHTCPVCWLRFNTGDIMHIAVHDSLRGDPLLGEDAQQRFLATRFNNAGQAFDAMGAPCLDIACPHCRRKLPPGFVEMPHDIISIVGDTRSGKSYYLAVLTKMLPAKLYRDFGIIFQDSDPTGNVKVNEMRKALFGAQTPKDAIVGKTQPSDMCVRVLRQGHEVLLPLPFVYTVARVENADERYGLIFYDIAGEYFQPTIDITKVPAALHVASAAGILYLFDPFNSPEFRRRIPANKDPQLEQQVFDQQDIILSEMRARIHAIHNLRAGEKIQTPLAFAVGKCDAWLHLLNGEPLKDPVENGRIDMSVIEENSDRIRAVMHELCPATVANAEAVSENVVYFAVSSFGHTPIKIGPVLYAPDPARLNPAFVESPLLWILAQLHPNLVATRAAGAAKPSP